jgi:NPCBM/NEW2 domain
MPDQTSHGPDVQDHGSARPQGRKPPRRTIRPELLAGIGTLLAGVAAILALFVHSAQQDKASSATTGARPPTTIAQTADAAGSATSVQPTVSAEPGPSTEYLADLETLSGGTPDTAPQDIRGSTYLHSISAQTGGCARNQKAAFVYNLGTHFRAFDAVVGLSDQSTEAARVEVRVIADSGSLFTAIVSVGHPKTVHVAVTGKLHMTVQQTYLGPNQNLCSEAGDVVWGDARLGQ